MNLVRFRLLLAFTFVATFLLGTTVGRAQTVITSLPYTVTSGGLYVLNSNLNSSQTSGNLITINASNVTIDFQNHYIAGPVGNTNQTATGVYASERSNVTLKNGTIAYCQYGLQLNGNGSPSTNSVDHQVDNMRVTYCLFIGIQIVASPASRVTNCQVSQTGNSTAGTAYGISASGIGATIQGNVIGNVIAQTSYGISLASTSIARQNTISGTTYGVIGGKYQDNLTSNCPNPYSGGLDAGGNN